MCYAHLKFLSDFRAHFEDVHCIEEPRSKCVSRKRKTEVDETKMQDTKGEALNYVSKKAKNGDEKGEGRNAGPTSHVIDIKL
jgi:hypothetical protein